MLYTGRGDNGNTTLYGSKEKLSKSSPITEALGSLDEVNSYLGICKSKAKSTDLTPEKSIPDMVDIIQNNLFIVQAQVAGADKKIHEDEIKKMEKEISEIENILPPINSFLISGSTELSAHFDFARTLVRRAERRVVALNEAHLSLIDLGTLAYLNRLSSLLYAYARLLALDSDKEEKKPTY